jgi:hypothetical protein
MTKNRSSRLQARASLSEMTQERRKNRMQSQLRNRNFWPKKMMIRRQKIKSRKTVMATEALIITNRSLLPLPKTIMKNKSW